jgi:sugar/nucleoside kinase (ribokinase family)
MTNKKYTVTGIGNAIVDIIIRVEEAFLPQNALYQSSMTLIKNTEAQKLAELPFEKIISGGSIANSIANLATFGVKTALIGKIGDDEFGDILAQELKRDNVDFFCRNKSSQNSTAQSFILITPDGKRTMATYLGDASDIKDEIDEKIIADSKILYLEGYLWDRPDAIDALNNAIKIAKNNQTLVAFNLSDSFCVIRHRKDFINLAPDLDILFGNKLEIEALIDMAGMDVNEISRFAQKANLILVVTNGEEGSIVFDGRDVAKFYRVRTDKIISPVDVTGAGDSFVSGFLYGFSKKYSLSKCAKIGNMVAGIIINKIGARLERKEIESLKHKLY